MPNFYDLDRLDLQATGTLNNAVQQAVSERLASAATREGAQAAGLYGFEMLRPQDDPSKIAYSFTLFERRDGANLMRVQTDSVNEPFDINQGARLNLGSTAKLRAIITYLQIVSELHARYASLSAAELRSVKPDPQDVLTRWALDYLAHTPDRSLQAMLDAAVERKYSANPGETFYTGGGAQTFNNFDASDNSRILTVHRAFQHSVNLVFVRMMRDIVHYEMIQTSGPPSQWLDDPAARQLLSHALCRSGKPRVHDALLREISRQDSRRRAGHHAARRAQVAAEDRDGTAQRAPDASQAWFDAQMRAALKGTPAASLSDDDLAKLYAKYGIDRFNLNDRGYIASVHPLDLWTVELSARTSGRDRRPDSECEPRCAHRRL